MKCVPEDDICGDGGGRWGTVDHFEDCVYEIDEVCARGRHLWWWWWTMGNSGSL